LRESCTALSAAIGWDDFYEIDRAVATTHAHGIAAYTDDVAVRK
jgi:hypothetical protein